MGGDLGVQMQYVFGFVVGLATGQKLGRDIASAILNAANGETRPTGEHALDVALLLLGVGRDEEREIERNVPQVTAELMGEIGVKDMADHRKARGFDRCGAAQRDGN